MQMRHGKPGYWQDLLWIRHLEKHCVATEKLQCFHGLKTESHYGVVIVDSVVDDESIGALLTLQDSCTKVLPLGPFLTAADSTITQSQMAFACQRFAMQQRLLLLR